MHPPRVLAIAPSRFGRIGNLRRALVGSVTSTGYEAIVPSSMAKNFANCERAVSNESRSRARS
jgi:hypothetical protein